VKNDEENKLNKNIQIEKQQINRNGMENEKKVKMPSSIRHKLPREKSREFFISYRLRNFLPVSNLFPNKKITPKYWVIHQ
jgi:hypothetical protein